MNKASARVAVENLSCLFSMCQNVIITLSIVYSPTPKVPDMNFQNLFIYIAGGIHNFFSCLVLIGYFMANNPQVSSIQLILRQIKWVCQYSVIILISYISLYIIQSYKWFVCYCLYEVCNRYEQSRCDEPVKTIIWKLPIINMQRRVNTTSCRSTILL